MNWDESKHPRGKQGDSNGGKFISASGSAAAKKDEKKSTEKAGAAAREAAGLPEEKLEWTDPNIVDWDNGWDFERDDPDDDENLDGSFFTSLYVGKNKLKAVQAKLRENDVDMDDPELMDSDMLGDGKNVYTFAVYVEGTFEDTGLDIGARTKDIEEVINQLMKDGAK